MVTDREVKSLRWFEDPGHSWLRVPLDYIVQLGITDKITNGSTIRGRHAYLEEDSDAAVFINGAKEAGFKVMKIPTTYTDNYSKVQEYPHFNQANFRLATSRIDDGPFFACREDDTPTEDKPIHKILIHKKAGFMWLVSEINPNMPHIAYGWANLNNDGCAEWGTMDLDEITGLGATCIYERVMPFSLAQWFIKEWKRRGLFYFPNYAPKIGCAHRML